MRIVFMGTPEFAVPCAERLKEAGHEFLGVFTQPDRPFGRKQILKAPPVKEWAMGLGIPVYQPEKIRVEENIEFLRRLAPDVIVVVAYGQILPKGILEIPPFGCINVHGSILPKYRGAAPIQWSVIDGEEKTGVTTMYMAEGLDTGDIIEIKELEIGKDETAGELHDRLSLLGADLIVHTLSALADGTARRTPQKDDESTYAVILNKNLSEVNWQKSATSIHNLVRGMNPWPVAWTSLTEKKVKIYSTTLGTEETQKAPGTILSAGKEGILVACGVGTLFVKELQLEGGKRLKVSDFLNGVTLNLGVDRFGDQVE